MTRGKVVVIVRNESFQCEAPEAIKKKLVMLVNRVRAAGCACGFRQYPAVGPVGWNPVLAKAALSHSRDMADNGFVGHKGTDGSNVGIRATKAGYKWRAVGENISAGFEAAEQIVSAWLNSPGHCRVIMNPDYSEIGAACYCKTSSPYGTYWTLMLASPKERSGRP